MWASSAGEAAVVGHLLDSGASVTPRSRMGARGYSATESALALQRNDVTEMFTSKHIQKAESRPLVIYRIDPTVFKGSLRPFIAAMQSSQAGQDSAGSETERGSLERLAASDPEAECALGIADLVGYGGTVNPYEARKHFKSAASRNSVLGHSLYAVMLMEGVGGDSDLSGAIEQLKGAESAHEPFGEWILGMLYDSGNGVEQSDLRAGVLLRRAVEDGAASAASSLLYGLFDDQNAKHVEDEIARSAPVARRAGDLVALNNIGVLNLYRGDFDVAAHLFEEALGTQSKQLKLLDPAVERGYPLLNLGLMKKFGIGRKMDRSLATDLLRRSAASKNSWAAVELAVECDLAHATCTRSEATTLLRQAAAGADDCAITRLLNRRGVDYVAR